MALYTTAKSLSNSSFIKLGIINYLKQELLTLKVEINDNFLKNLQNEDENLQEIIQFEYIGPKETKIILSMTGWGQGEEWVKTYEFFVKGNLWTYEQLIKLY